MTGLLGAPSGGPQLLRAMNEQALLESIRRFGPISRADLARHSGLSKPTVAIALTNLDHAGLVQRAGLRTGQPGPAALLYEVRPDAGYVLGVDVGRRFVRCAIADLSGQVRARSSVPVHAREGLRLVAEMVGAADLMLAEAGMSRSDVTQTVIGTPGVYDPRRNSLALTGERPGWGKPAVLIAMREAFGDDLLIENDVDAAALAERAYGHGRAVDDFAFAMIGTGIGVGLMLGGRLRRGAHGAAGEIGYLPLADDSNRASTREPQLGGFESVASAAGVVRAAKKAGLRGANSAEEVFRAALSGDPRAQEVVRIEAVLIARALAAVIAVADPELIILGGGIGEAEGFVDAVAGELVKVSPIVPNVLVSALGEDAVVDGCLVTGAQRAWERAINSHLARLPD